MSDIKYKKRIFFCSKCKKAFEMSVPEDYEYKNEVLCAKCHPMGPGYIYTPYIPLIITGWKISEWDVNEDDE